VVEHLHDSLGCRTLFATHYHELTKLADELPGVANYNVAVREWSGEVIFLHQIVAGAADKSYGIHVAQMAGVPREVNRRANEILASLESTSPTQAERNGAHGKASRRIDRGHRNGAADRFQLTLFELAEHPLLETIRNVDLDATSPRDAVRLIQEWQEQLAAEGAGRTQAARTSELS
jgi:DNA mismatch repair protein MutS